MLCKSSFYKPQKSDTSEKRLEKRRGKKNEVHINASSIASGMN